MFLLLIVAAVIYFILGEPRDGAIMLIFVTGVISIEVVQELKTDKTLNALKDLSAPHIIVIRDGIEQRIASADLVPGDLMMIYEGVKIPADGHVIKCNQLCVDESSLTGEAEGVWKVSTEAAMPRKDYWRRDYCYAGTLVIQGTATVKVDKIGAFTEYGKIGVNLSEATKEYTPLQKQTGRLVTTCAIIAGVLFILVGIITWFNLSEHEFAERLIESILSGITLSMAMIPEEFPVILTIFLSMGAWRLAKKNSLVRKLPSVETLGAVSAMGKRGSEVSREAADLILMDDNFTTIVETVSDGRRIYDNIRKAVGYVFVIHIPIALTALLGPFLGIGPADLMLLPVHVVLLELIIDPTCSIVLERQPTEMDIMERAPRDPGERMLTSNLIFKSLLQGLTVFAASFGVYIYTLASNPDNAPLARALGLVVIMLANLFLVQVNSSNHDCFLCSVFRLAKDKVMWAVNIGTVVMLIIILYTPLSGVLKLAAPSLTQFLMVLGLAMVSVLWYEIVKLVKRIQIKKTYNKGIRK